METPLPFETIPPEPEDLTGPTVLVRLIDGLGFRFHWATEGLREEDLDFKPGGESMTIGELVRHIAGLIHWTQASLEGEPVERPAKVPPPRELRPIILKSLQYMRDKILSLGETGLWECEIHGQPFWNMINGPLSDALTHVGQINAFRRLAGNPTPSANVFRGLPPDPGS